MERDTIVIHRRDQAIYRNLGYETVDITRNGRFLGNPYQILSTGDRETAISQFKAYFERRLRRSIDFFLIVLECRGKALVCWCKPKPCHGDVIKGFLDGLPPMNPDEEMFDYWKRVTK